ncbi:GATA transcription factor 21-like [Macadamia integrifolia]|uniref:GATA transcription factor 21-like n=1 Tax=Macadamia integrifolia TaxID=60698 RepID=UPI001C4F9A45|nr:GATA transcription factor 21-like [Macadamia integrifolia]
MNPVYLINPPLPSPFPLVEPNDDRHLQFFTPSSDQASSSSLSNFIFSNLAQEQGVSYDREQQQQQQQQQEAIKCVLQVRSSDHHEFLESPSLPTVENGLTNDHREDYQNNGGSVKWMSSKMRLIRKMTDSDRTGADKQVENKHKFEDHLRPPSPPLDTDNSSNSSSNNCNNNNNSNTIRVCSDCYTTKTPLWRSGPRGPKSLCNACGIRQRKARRAMAAAAAAAEAASSGVLRNETTSMRTKVQKEKRTDKGYVQQYKKRCKHTSPSSRKNELCFEDFTINLSKNLAFHQVFPQDEKEAAILLMALSCGLVHS